MAEETAQEVPGDVEISIAAIEGVPEGGVAVGGSAAGEAQEEMDFRNIRVAESVSTWLWCTRCAQKSSAVRKSPGQRAPRRVPDSPVYRLLLSVFSVHGHH